VVKIVWLKLTKPELPLYIITMENDHSYQDEPLVETNASDEMLDTTMTAVAGLTLLTERVDQLVQLCEHLTQENQVLRDQQTSLQTECNILREKNEQSRARIDAMVARLKGLGQG